jgi:hypothetical protein
MTAAHSRHPGSLAWPVRHTHLPLLLLLLVGFIRYLVTPDERADQFVDTCHQLLGRGYLRPDLLAHVLSIGCGEAADHDRSSGRRSGRRPEAIPPVEGCCGCCRTRRRVASVLARIFTVLLESVSRECDGAAGV